MSNTETHFTRVKCGSFQLLLVDTVHRRHWEHPWSFFNRAGVVTGGFGHNVAVLFILQYCLWATFGCLHNVVMNKSIFRDSVCIYRLYIYTHISICHGVSEKSTETEPLQLLF